MSRGDITPMPREWRELEPMPMDCSQGVSGQVRSPRILGAAVSSGMSLSPVMSMLVAVRDQGL